MIDIEKINRACSDYGKRVATDLFFSQVSHPAGTTVEATWSCTAELLMDAVRKGLHENGIYDPRTICQFQDRTLDAFAERFDCLSKASAQEGGHA